jgi:hypothetical protein
VACKKGPEKLSTLWKHVPESMMLELEANVFQIVKKAA